MTAPGTRPRPLPPGAEDSRPGAEGAGPEDAGRVGADPESAGRNGVGTASAGRAGRDPAIDAVRAFAIVGVVAGHWLVTGLVPTADGLRTASPLSAVPGFAPVSWVFQTLGLFFFAGGFAAARSRARRGTTRARDREGGRKARLLRPVLTLLTLWGVAAFLGAALGAPAVTLRTLVSLALSPLWFLLPYLALTVATSPLIRVVARVGLLATLPPIAVVAACDAGLLPGLVALPAAWAVPWILGLWSAASPTRKTGGHIPAGRDASSATNSLQPAGQKSRGQIPATSLRPAGVLLVLGGALALAALIRIGHYPASAVGVPGAGRSNLSPPSLLTVALAVTQTGVFLLLRDRLPHGKAVAALNRAAVGIYLTHQSVLLAVVGVAALVNPRTPGLLTAPDRPAWVVHRLAWLPLLALVLWLATRRRTRLP
jgi:hypothetical protein